MLFKSLGAADKDNALFADCSLDVGVGRLAVELGLHTGKELPLLLRDTEALKGFLDIIGHVVPTALGLLSLREVVADVLEDDVLEILGRPVGRHRLLKELAIALLAERPYPVGIFLHVADVVDGGLCEANAGIKGVIHFVAEIAHGAVDVDLWLGFYAHLKLKIKSYGAG